MIKLKNEGHVPEVTNFLSLILSFWDLFIL